MGISNRHYARIRGVSETAVRKALKTGRIRSEPDGTIDVERANREWQLNTHQKGKQPLSQLGEKTIQMAPIQMEPIEMTVVVQVNEHMLRRIVEAYVQKHLSKLGDAKLNLE